MARQEWSVRERRFVVELKEPVPDARVTDVAATVAERFGLDPTRLHRLLSGRTGPVTKPVLEEKADLIARAFAEAGVAVTVYPAATDTGADPDDAGAQADDAAQADGQPTETAGEETTVGAVTARAESVSLFGDGEPEPAPSSALLSSTRWMPSPHEAAEPSELGDVDGTDDHEPAPSPPAGTGPLATAYRPPTSGPSLRTYLLIGFFASLVLLVVLQAVNGMAAGRTRTAGSVETGMQAYGNGDFALAERIWTPLARGGDPRAQYMLGYMAQNGQGRPWSNHDAAAWYRLASDQGYPQARVALGELYVRGMGVPRDPGAGAQLFLQAAENGYGPAQFQYALALFRGTGVHQDFAAALHWFRLAARNGVADAEPYVAFAGSAAGASNGP